jgi:hypothetical protein
MQKLLYTRALDHFTITICIPNSVFRVKLQLRGYQMGNIWKKVERGIRYRKHLTRKYGVPRRFDRYYVIRIAVGGVMRQEALGWESEGITLEKAA